MARYVTAYAAGAIFWLSRPATIIRPAAGCSADPAQITQICDARTTHIISAKAASQLGGIVRFGEVEE